MENGYAEAGEEAAEEELYLHQYINFSAVAVPETFSIERSYLIFRSMGLRHLTVVDEHNRVKGIVTRKVRYPASVLLRQPLSRFRLALKID